jgi:hypothetical protein
MSDVDDARPSGEDAQEFVLTDANGHTINGERYRDPDAAIDARVRLMETHPDGDQVTVEPWGEGFDAE